MRRAVVAVVTVVTVGAGLLLAVAAGARAAEPLNVCVAENNPPLSQAVDGGLRGLDVRLAQAIADDLQRPLRLVPFESRYEADSTLANEVNALLSSGVCALASGFPLLASDLGQPARPTARVPDHPGAKRPPQRAWVPLGALAPTAAYHAVAFGLVVREAAREAATLASLASDGGARIGASAGTMAGTVLSMAQGGRLRGQLVSLSQNQDALAELEAGRIDATLVSFDRYDAWRLSHAGSTLRRAAYVHPLRINIGFVGLAGDAGLLAAASRSITAALADGRLQQWAADAGSTWVPPVQPLVGAPVGIAELLRE